MDKPFLCLGQPDVVPAVRGDGAGCDHERVVRHQHAAGGHRNQRICTLPSHKGTYQLTF